MADVKYALFIEPNGSLRALLVAAKASVEAWRPGQMYCDHPPHCTLLMGSYSPPEVWLPDLRLRLSKCDPFNICISKWLVFPNDIAAGGGQTVAMAATPCPELFNLQAAAAEVLGPHQVPAPSLWTVEPYVTSQKRFGFPFVGKHWRPHFTVASLSTTMEDPFVSQITELHVDAGWTVHTVGLWAIAGSKHARMASIPIGQSV